MRPGEVKMRGKKRTSRRGEQGKESRLRGREGHILGQLVGQFVACNAAVPRDPKEVQRVCATEV